MNDGLIGLIILIAVLNIVGRIVKGISRAAQQKKAPPEGSGLSELLEKLNAAARNGEDPVAVEDERPFSWLRDEEEQDTLSPAPLRDADDPEFIAHPEIEYKLDDRLVVAPVPIDISEELFEKVPGMPLAAAGEPALLADPARVEHAPRGLDDLVDRRFTGLRRGIVYAQILGQCPAVRRRPSLRRL